jgi:hypothetical protein
MPRRTNLFQRVVRVLHETIGEDATIEESKMLVDSDTGQDREVDVVITRKIAGHKILVGVEARASKRKADVGWVEGLLRKHATLPTAKLVLVSESGFAESARRKAVANHAVPLAPEDLGSDFETSQIVNKLGSIYPKVISLDLLDVVATCKSPTGNEEANFEPPAGVHVFCEGDGSQFGTITDIAASQFNQRFLEVAERVDLANVTHDLEKDITLTLGGPFLADRTSNDGTREAAKLCLNPHANKVNLGLWPIENIQIKGKMRIEVGEIPLSHKRIPQISEGFSFGEGKVGNTNATFIVNETRGGSKGRMILETKDGPIEGEIHTVPDSENQDGCSAD